jgi:hypothetical protein
MRPVLPSDVFPVIFGHLGVQDFSNARQVRSTSCVSCLFSWQIACKACKQIYELTKRSFWYRVIHERVLKHNIPVPGLAGREIDSLDVHELEKSLYEALKLHHNWRSQSPKVVRQVDMPGMPDSRVVALHFITEQGRRWLVSLSMSPGRRFVIHCWDLQASPPSCRAQRELQIFRGIAINQGVSTPGSIAILNPQ